MVKRTTKSIQNAKEKKRYEEKTSSNAKLVLFIFGIGPLILIGWFLNSKGFFN